MGQHKKPMVSHHKRLFSSPSKPEQLRNYKGDCPSKWSSEDHQSLHHRENTREQTAAAVPGVVMSGSDLNSPGFEGTKASSSFKGNKGYLNKVENN
jgi:hypothetical protein